MILLDYCCARTPGPSINRKTGTVHYSEKETKAKDGWQDPYITSRDPDYGKIWKDWEIYGTTCFHYIHKNPVRAGLASSAEAWEFSSAKDFAGLRNGSLCNYALAKELLYLP
ncbi:MAG: hypothetical protein IPL65_07015 [Lewinellaceae bacterium]|nr:hypothetical protein [Lewinellaceae bacterium]